MLCKLGSSQLHFMRSVPEAKQGLFLEIVLHRDVGVAVGSDYDRVRASLVSRYCFANSHHFRYQTRLFHYAFEEINRLAEERELAYEASICEPLLADIRHEEELWETWSVESWMVPST